VKGKAVRPQKITEELIYKICEDIARGYSYDQAALNNGISASTFFRWVRKGKEPDAEQIYKDLVRLVDEASEFSEAEALQLIRSEAIVGRNWKASAWFLERRFPEKYGKKNITDLKKEEQSDE
jgi:transposase-like protein